jgi:hypothetical protein
MRSETTAREITPVEYSIGVVSGVELTDIEGEAKIVGAGLTDMNFPKL